MPKSIIRPASSLYYFIRLSGFFRRNMHTYSVVTIRSLCTTVYLSQQRTIKLAIVKQGSQSPWKVLEFWGFLEMSLKMNLSLKSPWILGTFLEISIGTKCSPWFHVLCILNWKFEWIQQIKRYKNQFSPKKFGLLRSHHLTSKIFFQFLLLIYNSRTIVIPPFPRIPTGIYIYYL